MVGSEILCQEFIAVWSVTFWPLSVMRNPQHTFHVLIIKKRGTFHENDREGRRKPAPGTRFSMRFRTR